MIFISYRRSEDAAFAGRLFDRLERTFRREALFMDVDSIAPGQDFVSILKARVAECDVLLALIGRGWLTATDEAGRRRLNNAEDFVRIEIEAALTQRKRVIPVLIDDVPMPRAEELPEELKPLVRCQAIRLSHDRFRADCDRLIRALTEKPSFKAAWERFRAHVRIPDWQTLLSKRVIIIGGVSVVLLVSLLSILTLPKPPGPDIPGWVPIYTVGKIENVMNGKYGGNFSVSFDYYMNGDLAHSVIDFYANSLEAEGFETKRANDGYSVLGKNDATGRTVAATARPGTKAAAVTFATSK